MPLMNVVQAISNRHPVSCYLGKCRHTTDMCPPLHNPECFVFLLHPCRTLTRRRWASLISLSSIIYIYLYIYILFCRKQPCHSHPLVLSPFLSPFILSVNAKNGNCVPHLFGHGVCIADTPTLNRRWISPSTAHRNALAFTLLPLFL